MTLPVTHILTFEETSLKGPVSGTEAHLIDLMKGLVKRDVDVELIALIKQHGPRLESLFLDLERQNIRVTQVQIGVVFDKWEMMKLLYDFCCERSNRIIHTHLPIASFYGRLAAFFARCEGIVDTQHNDDPKDAEGFQQLKWQALNWLTDMTIAISDNVRNFLINRVGLPPEKVETIHYGIHPPEVLLPKEKVRSDLGIPQDKFCVGYVGHLSRHKNIPLIFEAVQKMPDVVVCLIGVGEEENYLRRSATEMGISDRVIFTGYMDFAADYMTAFDLMVLPSRWEGLGLVLLEAMIRHVPVAGSRNGAIPEILGQGRRGFLFEKAHELTSIIDHMKRSSYFARDNEVTAYQDVLSQFTIPAMVEKTRRIYQTILGSEDN